MADPLNVDAFASVTARLGLANPVELSPEGAAAPGTVVVVRALSENPLYPDLEHVDGTQRPVRTGQLIAGALGSRQALRGFVGYSPYKVSAGDTLHLLNLGGVVGRCIGGHKDLGDAVPVEVVGFATRDGRPVHLRDAALPEVSVLGRTPPIVLVLGSCMNVGKTAASIEIVRGLARKGLRVGAGKISGVACLRDTRRMELAGAVAVHSFVDCGHPSTVDGEDVGAIARSIVSSLAAAGPDAIVIELGDGILGHYHVESALEDPSLMANVAATVFCAGDLVSAWGGRELLHRMGVGIDVVCGPTTDNVAGTTYVENAIGLPAANALTETDKLLSILAPKLARTALHG